MHTLLEPGDRGFLLTDIGRLIYRAFENKATQLGYTRPQWQALAHLSHNPGVTQVTLAHLMEIEPITLSRHLDKMERDGLLERRSDPNDRRVKRLFLTEKSEPQLKEIEAVRDKVLEDVFTGITPEHESMFREVLLHIRKNLLEKQ